MMVQTRDEAVRAIARKSKGELVTLIEQWAREHGRRFVVGGPRQWSKDELVSAAVRIHDGGQP